MGPGLAGEYLGHHFLLCALPGCLQSDEQLEIREWSLSSEIVSVYEL